MSVSFGFYNSKNGDRRYDAIQMSSIFDGIVQDGIIQHVGTAMMVKASDQEEMIVHVGIGRAWFNHTWTLNDSILPLSVSMSEVILDRIDMVVIDIDSRDDYRTNAIKIVKGTADSNPSRPVLVKEKEHLSEKGHWQYPLA